MTAMTPSLKICSVSLIAVVAAIHLLNTGYADWSAGANMAYVLALLFLFFSREHVEDERVQLLKLKAIFVGFLVGWAVVGAVRFAYYLKDRTLPWTMSAYDVMFVMLLAAFAMFQYWNWQDGRVVRD